MAYCLRSFVQLLEEVLHPDQHHKKWVLDHDKKPQIQSLLENATFLRNFLENLSPPIQDRIAGLEDQLMDVTGKAEDNLETYLTSQLVSNLEGQVFAISPPDLGEAIQAFEDAKQEVVKIMGAKPVQRSDDNMPLPVSTTRYPNHNNVLVGVTEDLNQLRDWLTSGAPELDTIPIVGMGGIGKTTLARILYDQYASSNSYFDCCAWVTISQTYNPQQILKILLDCMPEGSQRHGNELVVSLHKTLFGRRYLIVLDDIWSCKAWDDMQRAFPQNDNGSRIILTTREKNVVDYVNSKCHEMHLINKDESWELLRRKVFGEESCPRDLEEVGKKIANNCGGLPLALQVVGGLLSQSQKSIEYWKYVAQNVCSLIAETDDQFSGIFSWSFAHLPRYLKPCFLYMAGYKEDEAIQASQIIKMWVSEGFLYPVGDKSLEEAARIHLNALVDRNLIFVRGRGKSGRAKTYGIHDLLRDMCLRKVQEEKFLYFKHLQTDNEKKFILRDPRFGRIVSIHRGEYPSPIVTPLTRSLRSYGYSNDKILSCLCFKLPLLRVLYLNSFVDEFPKVILQLVNLRYLNILTVNFTPVSISLLRNLQTLIVYRISSLATMISDLPQLQHLKCKFVYTKEEYSELAYGVHENLQSLSRRVPAEEVRKLLGKLPNLRKLRIKCHKDEFIDLTSFHNLETLHCLETRSYSRNMTSPVSLKKLKLKLCKLDQSDLKAIGALPNLQILVLYCMYPKMDWEPCEGGFRELRYLEFKSWDVVNWVATEVHYPVLEHLVLTRCYHLTEIPIDFVYIETLLIIEVDNCLPSVFESAKLIYEEQCQFGNTALQLRLGLDTEETSKMTKESFKAAAEERGKSKGNDGQN